jgi:hypothetical protein
MTDGLGNRGRICRTRERPAHRARSINPHPAVGQSPGEIGHHRPIPKQITVAAEPVDFRLVIRDRRRCHGGNRGIEGIGKSNAVSFARCLYVGLNPRDQNGGELPVVADLTSTDGSSGFSYRGVRGYSGHRNLNEPRPLMTQSGRCRTPT